MGAAAVTCCVRRGEDEVDIKPLLSCVRREEDEVQPCPWKAGDRCEVVEAFTTDDHDLHVDWRPVLLYAGAIGSVVAILPSGHLELTDLPDGNYHLVAPEHFTNIQLVQDDHVAIRFLPEFANGRRVLTARSEPHTYLVDGSQLDADVLGLDYRMSMNMKDRDRYNHVDLGDIVNGDLLNGWLRVHLLQASSRCMDTACGHGELTNSSYSVSPSDSASDREDGEEVQTALSRVTSDAHPIGSSGIGIAIALAAEVHALPFDACQVDSEKTTDAGSTATTPRLDELPTPRLGQKYQGHAI